MTWARALPVPLALLLLKGAAAGQHEGNPPPERSLLMLRFCQSGSGR